MTQTEMAKDWYETKPPGFHDKWFSCKQKRIPMWRQNERKKTKTKYLYDPLLFLLALNL